VRAIGDASRGCANQVLEVAQSIQDDRPGAFGALTRLVSFWVDRFGLISRRRRLGPRSRRRRQQIDNAPAGHSASVSPG